MSHYRQIKKSTGQTAFYPVPETADCATSRALFLGDTDPEPELLTSLPTLPADEEWYYELCTPTTPETPGGGSGGSGNVTSSLINQTYGNTVVVGVVSSDPSVMNIELYVENGRVKARDLSGRVAGPGEQLKYLINNRYFDDIAQWNGPKGVPHLFQKFIAPAGRPLSALRDNPVTEACQKLAIY